LALHHQQHRAGAGHLAARHVEAKMSLDRPLSQLDAIDAVFQEQAEALETMTE
jgi:hypothetical protein